MEQGSIAEKPAEETLLARQRFHPHPDGVTWAALK